jgi:hypothetical protein
MAQSGSRIDQLSKNFRSVSWRVLGAAKRATGFGAGLGVVLLVFSGAGFVACGDRPLVYEGETGRAVAMKLIDGIPAVEVAFDEGANGPILIDSGSPLTLISQHAVPLGDTVRQGRLDGLGPVFPTLEVAVAPLFSADDPCAGDIPIGLVGADLLSNFRVRFDHGNEQFTLLASDADTAGDASEARTVAFELRGGGLVSIDDAKLRIGATRIIVRIEIEGTQLLGLIDTAASTTIIDRTLLEELQQSARPTRCCVGVGGYDLAPIQAPLVRLQSLVLGPVERRDLVALALPAEPLLGALSREVGEPIRAIIGANALRGFDSEIDYQRFEWLFWERPEFLTNVDSYVSAGFSYCRSRRDSGQLLALDIYEDTDASRVGLQPGSRIEQIDGRDVAQLDDDEVRRLLTTLRTEPLEVLVAGDETPRFLEVTDVLPPFES